MLKKIVIGSWVFILGLLFLYSFTQVDLGLTLNRSSVITDIQKSFQYVGYFNRPLSAVLASGIFVLLFVAYVLTLRLAWRKKISLGVVKILICLTAAILLFSYNAFSYDLFNYIFDAKIVTHYGENPYVQKALDYPGDPMLGFMHWTHRTYPYGPVWIGLTIPISFIGSQIFILTFYLFKLLMVGSYLFSSFLIYKIAKQGRIIDPVFALVFFALNPLVIVESLVSAHHDLVMMAITLLGVYFLFESKKYSAWLFLIISIGIKFATAVLAPIFLWFPFSKRKNKETLFLFGSFVLMTIAVILASERTTFQPWYLLFVMPFATLLSHKYYIFIPIVIISFLSLFQYLPFLYTGNFDPPIPMIMDYLLIFSLVLSVFVTAAYKLFKK